MTAQHIHINAMKQLENREESTSVQIHAGVMGERNKRKTGEDPCVNEGLSREESIVVLQELIIKHKIRLDPLTPPLFVIEIEVGTLFKLVRG